MGRRLHGSCLARSGGGEEEARRRRVVNCVEAHRRESRGGDVRSGEDGGRRRRVACVWKAACRLRRRRRRRVGFCQLVEEGRCFCSMGLGSSRRVLDGGGGFVWDGRRRRCRRHRICLSRALKIDACRDGCRMVGHDGGETRRGHPRKPTWHFILLCSGVVDYAERS